MDRILTPAQERFLQGFFRSGGLSFYLTGGTALAAFYLQHRYSDDLDFFTREAEDLRRCDDLVERGVREAGLALERVPPRDREHRRFDLSGDPHATHPLVKCDIMFDTPPHFADPVVIAGVRVDALLSIAVNKLDALSRREPKDYVDLYLILRQGNYRMEDLIPRVQQKDPGLTALDIASTFDRLAELPDLERFQDAYMVVPVDAAGLIGFYRGWARRLVEALPPERPAG